MKIEYQPIGFIRSPFDDVTGIPIQPSRAENVKGTIEISHEFAEGLSDLDGFSHIIVLYHLHKSKPYQLKIVPFLDTELRGVFATRAPSRPNPIGISVVRLLDIVDNVLFIEGVDIVDGTPVLDIKPYVSEFDCRSEAQVGWLETARKDGVVADDRFK